MSYEYMVKQNKINIVNNDAHYMIVCDRHIQLSLIMFTYHRLYIVSS